MKVEYYNNIHDKKYGYCLSNSHIKINMAHHELSVQLKATIVHEITHALLHMSKKHYTPMEKEYQARLTEYNFCHSLESKKALLYYKKLLKEKNRNLTPLREEIRRIYPEILRISSLSWFRHHQCIKILKMITEVKNMSLRRLTWVCKKFHVHVDGNKVFVVDKHFEDIRAFIGSYEVVYENNKAYIDLDLRKEDLERINK